MGTIGNIGFKNVKIIIKSYVGNIGNIGRIGNIGNIANIVNFDNIGTGKFFDGKIFPGSFFQKVFSGNLLKKKF